MSGFRIGNDNDFVKQMEFLLGKKIPKNKHRAVGSAFHLKTSAQGVLAALKVLNKTIDDVIYEQDRKVLRGKDERN